MNAKYFKIGMIVFVIALLFAVVVVANAQQGEPPAGRGHGHGQQGMMGDCPAGEDCPMQGQGMMGMHGMMHGQGMMGDCPAGEDCPMQGQGMMGMHGMMHGQGMMGDCPAGADCPIGQGNGPGPNAGQGNCPLGEDCPFSDDTATSPVELTDEAATALTSAIELERNAYATYTSVSDQFEGAGPFDWIATAEQHHIAALERAFTYYGVTLPEAAAVEVPEYADLNAAVDAAISIEQSNADFYTEAAALVSDYPELARVFAHLGHASEYMHLPAFQRWAA